jgi:hypothetical protein
MNMKEHILTALQEQFNGWCTLLEGLDESQVSLPLDPSAWTIGDVVNHLWAWQQRTLARAEAALAGGEPRFPPWPEGMSGDTPESLNAINNWIYEKYRGQFWQTAYENWKTGFAHLLEIMQEITEKDLLDGDRYAWLKGYALADILLATYEHHQEHLESLQTWLKDHPL